jgi:dipeptidyl-peptidase-4
VAAAARWLGARPGIDKDRIGLWGWSYGGYLAVMTLLRTGKLFKAGVAVAPLADWKLYDTAYTERYLGHPKTAPKAYAQSNPLKLAARLKTNLLLIHGMADDNVLLQHTLLLAQAFQKQGSRFDLMLYPGKKHSLKGTPTRKHLLGELLAYFQRHLQPASVQ